VIEVGDFREALSDDVLHALELLEEIQVPAACCHLSVDALWHSRGRNNQTRNNYG
jgi:hypothetical protein